MSGGHRNVQKRSARRRFAGSVALLFGAITLAGARFVLPAGAGTEPVSFPLVERNDSGVSGNVVLEVADGVTWFTVDVTGPDTNYLPILRVGTCEAFENDTATPLALVALGDPVATAIDIPIERLTSGGYMVDLHVADGSYEELLDPATSVACGAIPESSEVVQSGNAEEPDGNIDESESAGGVESGAGGEPDAGDGAVGGSTSGGLDELQQPDAGVGPIQSDRDWMMVIAALLGVASFVLAVKGLRVERRATYAMPAYASVHASIPTTGGSIVAHRAHRVRGFTRGLSQ
jgi:hypothetical protein